ncbi:MAG: GAF domain-containing sensor histidine kinase [Candidatus Gracilibacteria bacterium]|nr:GAF domain-containing sensor histidine kinase [Candidatus Gracilibacteria bacterium]
MNYLDIRLVGFWGISQDFGFSDLFFGIILYLVFYTIFKKYIFGNNEYVELTKRIGKLKKKILFLSNFYSLNSFLNKEFASLIKTKYVNISLYDEKNNNLEGLKKYFEKDSSYNLFINDTVFIEENKHKFDADKIAKEISEKSYLIFPLMNNTGDFLGVFEVGTKSFKDIYTSEEIDIIAEFAEFLILQLKHIEIYSQIQDMNINLDKKIDEKTIEYNNLLNKQTDFIAMISHEIKSPLGSCIFQIDSIIDDIKSGNQDKKYLLKELEILNTQLLNVGDLTKTMFSIKKFDLNKVELFKQKVDINVFLNEKVQNHKKENIEFILDITDDLHYINIDKIQFGQVIDNLIVNAIKFTNKETPKIYIKAKLEENNLIFEIEDNGEGFEGVDAENIFDKYTTGKISDVGIGMGMYLCKKIVELHGGNIKAGNGEYLPGASFKIVIPNIID